MTDDLTPKQWDLLGALPDLPADGKLCKGPRLRIAENLERMGLAQRVGSGFFNGGKFVRTQAGKRKLGAGKPINLRPADLDLLRQIERSPTPYLCVGSKYRRAVQLADRRLVEATSPAADNAAAFKLLPRGIEALKQRTPPPAPRTDGFGDPIDKHSMYYVQDKRSVVGNCASWWRQGGGGYTCEIEEAGAYTGAAVLDMRDTDIPWPVNEVQKLTVEHVRVEALRRAVDDRKAAAS